MGLARKTFIGFLSALSWVVLSLAILATSANFIVNGLSHVGNSASALIQEVANSPTALTSIVDEIVKNADPDTVKQIEKNRATIDETLALLGNSPAFRDSIAKTLNQIAQALLNGDSSVRIDFSGVAAIAAQKVNIAAKSTVISKKELAKVVPTTIDLSKQTKIVKNIKKYLQLSLLLWILWLAIFITLYFLKGKRVLRTFGIQLLSVGALGLVVRFGAPALIAKMASNGSTSDYKSELIPKAFKLISGPAFGFGIVLAALGFLLFMADFLTRNKNSTPQK